MDLSHPHDRSLFLSVYGRLHRAGPGSEAHTRRALELVPGEAPRTVLDLGCGPGAQTLDLARALPDATILAIDIMPEMIDEASRRIRAAGAEDRVAALVGDMRRPPVDEGSQDLIWCEGAIYFLGVEDALRRWRPLLSSSGAIAFTEVMWLSNDPPPELRQWWASEYPAMSTEFGIRTAIEAAGFETCASFVLPQRAWWDEYYDPMEGKLEELRRTHPDDSVALEIIDMAEREMQMCQRYCPDEYSYGFFVVRPDTSSPTRSASSWREDS